MRQQQIVRRPARRAALELARDDATPAYDESPAALRSRALTTSTGGVLADIDAALA